MLSNRNQETWSIPAPKKPTAAKLKRLGPATQFAPIKVKRPAPVKYCELSFEDMHRARGTLSDKCRPQMSKPARNGGEIWTPEDIRRIVQMKRDGMSVPQIAEAMGRSKASVYKRFQRIGDSTNRRKWTEARLSVIRDLLRKGYTVAQVGEEMGVSAGAMSKVVQTYHLRRYIK